MSAISSAKFSPVLDRAHQAASNQDIPKIGKKKISKEELLQRQEQMHTLFMEKFEAISNELKDAKKRISDQSLTIQSLNITIEDLNQEVIGLRNENKELRKLNEEHKSEVILLQNENTKLITSIKFLVEELSECREKIKSKDENIEKTKKEIEEKIKEINTYKEKVKTNKLLIGAALTTTAAGGFLLGWWLAPLLTPAAPAIAAFTNSLGGAAVASETLAVNAVGGSISGSVIGGSAILGTIYDKAIGKNERHLEKLENELNLLKKTK